MAMCVFICTAVFSQGYEYNTGSRYKSEADLLDEAIRKLVGEAFYNDNIRERARVAVISVSSRDRDMREFLRSGIENELVNCEFTLIEKRFIEQVLAEQTLQQGWEYDERTVANVGKLTGAKYSVIARMEGNGDFRHISMAVVDNETGVRAGSARIRFEERR